MPEAGQGAFFWPCCVLGESERLDEEDLVVDDEGYYSRRWVGHSSASCN